MTLERISSPLRVELEVILAFYRSTNDIWTTTYTNTPW